jgi:hypothetical protein
MRGLKNVNLQILENRYRPQSLEVVADDTLGENMLRINNLPAVTV